MPAYLSTLPANHIFVPLDPCTVANYPAAYLYRYLGGVGLLGELTPDSTNGWEPVRHPE